VVTKGNDKIEFLVRKLIDRLGPMLGNIDSHLLHRGHRQGMDRGGFRTGGEGLDLPRQVMVDQPLGHLAPGAVMGADEEDSFHEHPPA